MIVEPIYRRALPQLFRSPVLVALATEGHSSVLDEVCLRGGGYPRSGGMVLSDVFESLYATMRLRYRCEYLFKNAIAAKVVLGRHSLRTATMLTELRVDSRKADLVVLNGTSTVYEIKTRLDNLDRLEDQLAAYRLLFDRIFVVTEVGCEARLAEIAGDDIGIIVLTNRYTLQTVREPTSHVDSVVPGVIFDTLRSGEYREILKRVFGEVPDVPAGRRYREHKALFATIQPRVAHNLMVEVLRKRTQAGLDSEFVAKLPHSLKAAGLTTSLSGRQRTRLAELLREPYVPRL